MKVSKQLKTALLVFVILGVCIAALSFFQPIRAAHRQQGITLTDRAATTLASVSVKNGFGSYTVTLENGVYFCEALRGLPISSPALDELAENCTSLHAVSRVKTPKDLSEIGLAKPRATVEIRFTDDTDLSFTLGARVPEEKAYYMQLSGSGAVYIISEASVSDFLVDVSHFVDLSLADNLNEAVELPAQMSFHSAMADFVIEQLPETTTDGFGNHFTHRIESADGSEAGFVDPTEFENYFARLHELRASSIVQLFPSPEELASFGLAPDNPAGISISFTIGKQTTTLRLGNRSDDVYYVYKDEVPVVYTLPLTQVPWDNVTYYALMSRFVAAPNLAQISHIEVSFPDGQYDIVVDGQTASCNGVWLSQRTFSGLYKLLCGARAEYEITGPADSTLPELTLTFWYTQTAEELATRTPTRSTTVRFLPYGLRRYAIEVDGAARYAVRAAYVSKVTETMLSLRDGMEITSAWF